MRTWRCLIAAGSILGLSLLSVVAAPAAPPVTAIYPSAAVLPANHLKFYIHFREPMRRGVFMDHCKLLDENGRAIPEPFREAELWSEDGKRLTLWLHPGRQKSGVNLNTEFGPVLAPGQRCTLVISGRWPTEIGDSGCADFEKSFLVGPRSTEQLDVREWRVVTPPVGSDRPLEVRFPAPLDHALLRRCLQVTKEDGTKLEGILSTTEAERCWRFKPAQPWTSETYKLAVDSILEDLAGNSLSRPFEVNLEERPPRKVPAVVSLPFTPSRVAARSPSS